LSPGCSLTSAKITPLQQRPHWRQSGTEIELIRNSPSPYPLPKGEGVASDAKHYFAIACPKILLQGFHAISKGQHYERST
jgi:hypothetical protein